MPVKTFAILISVLILLSVVELIRRQKMTFKYSMFWLGMCLTVLFFAFNETLLKDISAFAGFELLSNFIFFLLLVFFIFLSLLLTIYINEQNSRSEILAQSIALIEHKLRQAEKKNENHKIEDGPHSTTTS
jgi:hypothetical protein